MEAELLIRRAAIEAQLLLDRLFAAGEPAVGSPLAQTGLRDGLEVVEDYLAHGEVGVAFEHLLYMIAEPPLTLPAASRVDIRRAAELLGMKLLLGKFTEPAAAEDPGGK